jgi:hypothetical protein
MPPSPNGVFDRRLRGMKSSMIHPAQNASIRSASRDEIIHDFKYRDLKI